jgi:biopolymer transport protein ExbB
MPYHRYQNNEFRKTVLYELLLAGGWIMAPILLSSILAMAIVIERLTVLRDNKVIPNGLVNKIWHMHAKGEINQKNIAAIRQSSHLGRVLSTALANRTHEREAIKQAVEEEGRQVVHELERYFSALGTIAAITPLLGLLGTVVGMIKVFSAITTAGVGDPTVLAGGISEALITTAAGLCVAIPALIFHRHLNAKVDRYALQMEEQAVKLVDVLKGQREQ